MRLFRSLPAALALAAAAAALFAPGCTDLDLEPADTATPNTLFRDAAAYESFIARVYAGFAVTGQEGPTGQSDISSLDEGFANYLRVWWQLQELPTDEAVIAWSDAGLPELVYQTWSSDNPFVRAMYYRIFFQVSIANEFLRESTPALLAERDIPPAASPDIARYRAEARYLRALSLYHGLDLFGAIPLYTEAQRVGDTPPAQRPAREVFDFIEAELAAIQDEVAPAGAGEYGRADRGAVEMLRARLLLNAVTYVGDDRYADARAAAEAVITSGAYALDPDYASLFGADNDRATEVIFAIPLDGESTQSYGATTFLVHASNGGQMDPFAYGIASGWQGLRATPDLVGEFAATGLDRDARALFFTEGQTLDIAAVSQFTNGYAVEKWRNIASDGTPGADLVFADTDYPMFRLAEAYLTYAEANLRGGGGDRATALRYVNLLRRRAIAEPEGTSFEATIPDEALTLDFLLAERARELYWEGLRRTDLIRYDRFTTADTWAWKGGVEEGAATEAFRRLYPIPASELLANPNLVQNEGY